MFEYVVFEVVVGDVILICVVQNVDICDDFYGIVKDQIGVMLWFDEGILSVIESDIVFVLVGLDFDEYLIVFSCNGGQI